MKEYRITVILKSEHDVRTRISLYTCDCFAEAIDLAIAFDMYPETISIRVEELETDEIDISYLFSKLNKIVREECEE